MGWSVRQGQGWGTRGGEWPVSSTKSRWNWSGNWVVEMNASQELRGEQDEGDRATEGGT